MKIHVLFGILLEGIRQFGVDSHVMSYQGDQIDSPEHAFTPSNVLDTLEVYLAGESGAEPVYRGLNNSDWEETAQSGNRVYMLLVLQDSNLDI